MWEVIDFHKDGAEYRAIFGVQVRPPNVSTSLADCLHDVGVETTTIFAGDGQAHRERFARSFLPVDVDPALVGSQREQVGTIGAVNGDTPSLGDVSHHGISRHRLAALRVPYHRTVDALNLDAPAQPNPVDDPTESRGLGLLHLVGGNIPVQRADDLADGNVSSANRDFETATIGQREGLRGPCQPVVIRSLEPAAPDLPGEDLATQAETDRLLLVVHPLLDLVTRTSGANVAQPVPAGLASGAGQDLHCVSALELAMERRDSAVHLGTLTLEANLSVHVEREVDWGGPFRQPLHVSMRSKDEDFVLIQVDLEELEELLGAVGVLLQLQQLPEPSQMLIQLVG